MVLLIKNQWLHKYMLLFMFNILYIVTFPKTQLSFPHSMDLQAVIYISVNWDYPINKYIVFMSSARIDVSPVCRQKPCCIYIYVVIHGLITVSAPSPTPIYLRSQLPYRISFLFYFFWGGINWNSWFVNYFCKLLNIHFV